MELILVLFNYLLNYIIPSMINKLYIYPMFLVLLLLINLQLIFQYYFLLILFIIFNNTIIIINTINLEIILQNF